MRRFRSQDNLAHWGWNRPPLVVIDYAAAVADDLHRWLVDLADHACLRDSAAGQDRPLRLLLLERQADTRGGWWRTVFGDGGPDAAAIRRLLHRPEPELLPAIATDGERRAVIATMLRRLGSDLIVPEPTADVRFDRQLAELSWGGEPLFLMLAAALAAKSSFSAVLALSRCDLAFEIAAMERGRIGKLTAGRLPADLACHVASLITTARFRSPTLGTCVAEWPCSGLRRTGSGPTDRRNGLRRADRAGHYRRSHDVTDLGYARRN